MITDYQPKQTSKESNYSKIPLSCCICCKYKGTWTTTLVVSIRISVVVTTIIDYQSMPLLFMPNIKQQLLFRK